MRRWFTASVLAVVGLCLPPPDAEAEAVAVAAPLVAALSRIAQARGPGAEAEWTRSDGFSAVLASALPWEAIARVGPGRRLRTATPSERRTVLAFLRDGFRLRAAFTVEPFLWSRQYALAGTRPDGSRTWVMFKSRPVDGEVHALGVLVATGVGGGHVVDVSFDAMRARRSVHRQLHRLLSDLGWSGMLERMARRAPARLARSEAERR